MEIAPFDHFVYGPIFALKKLPDGRDAAIVPLLYNVRLFVGQPNAPTYDDMWDYDTAEEAKEALKNWQGRPGTEPQGWIRHPPSGRRRAAGGDPATEWICL